eukprot:scaffold22145_cov107-Skeletonema_marinoi.AAC.1
MHIGDPVPSLIFSGKQLGHTIDTLGFDARCNRSRPLSMSMSICRHWRTDMFQSHYRSRFWGKHFRRGNASVEALSTHASRRAERVAQTKMPACGYLRILPANHYITTMVPRRQ